MKIIYNEETGMWEEYKEPYGTVDCPTKEDFDILVGLMDAHCKCGKTVWVVERDEAGIACDYSGHVFLTAVRGMAIVSPTINDSGDPDDILNYAAERTYESGSGCLEVFPLADCCWSQEEAEDVMERGGADG